MPSLLLAAASRSERAFHERKAQGQQHKQQMAGLLHGNSTPAGISCGRPHCVILLSVRAVAGRKYHYPCRDPRETVCLRLFYGQIKPLFIFAVILFPRGPKADESWRIYRRRFSHIRATAVNVFRLLDIKFPKNRRAKEKGPHYLCSFRGPLHKIFFRFFSTFHFLNRKSPSLTSTLNEGDARIFLFFKPLNFIVDDSLRALLSFEPSLFFVIYYFSLCNN